MYFLFRLILRFILLLILVCLMLLLLFLGLLGLLRLDLLVFFVLFKRFFYYSWGTRERGDQNIFFQGIMGSFVTCTSLSHCINIVFPRKGIMGIIYLIAICSCMMLNTPNFLNVVNKNLSLHVTCMPSN